MHRHTCTLFSQIIPFVLGNISEGNPEFQDNVKSIVECWLLFDEYVFLLRRTVNTHKTLVHLVQVGVKLQKALMETFPNKSGQANAWNFIKFHLMLKFHIIIAMYGSVEGVNTQATERAHISFIKRLARLVNSHDAELQVILHHRRMESSILAVDLLACDDEEADSDDEGCDVDRRRHPIFGFPWLDAITNPSSYERNMCCSIRDPSGRSHNQVPAALLLDRDSWICDAHDGLSVLGLLIAEYIYKRFGAEACIPAFAPVRVYHACEQKYGCKCKVCSCKFVCAPHTLYAEKQVCWPSHVIPCLNTHTHTCADDLR
jgi:hypothetical protein